MLKRFTFERSTGDETQPPSGGCVLKLIRLAIRIRRRIPAAFRRLCVETCHINLIPQTAAQPPSGGCVLKRGSRREPLSGGGQPPSGGCVLKLPPVFLWQRPFCQPPSGGCVLKLRTWLY